MSYGQLHHDNRSNYAVTRKSGSRSPTLRKVTKYESESGSSDLESLDGLEAQQGYELKDLKKPLKGSDRSKAAGTDGAGESDNEDGDNSSRFTETASSNVGTYSKTKGYTSDEEKSVRRKFDRRLVLFVAFLYMLSFLDRSSKSSTFA
jgi:hypothetical protein